VSIRRNPQAIAAMTARYGGLDTAIAQVANNNTESRKVAKKAVFGESRMKNLQWNILLEL
jgi:hypothetical protein